MNWLYIGVVAIVASVVFYIIERRYQPPAPHGCVYVANKGRSYCASICRGAVECQVMDGSARQVMDSARFCYCDEAPGPGRGTSGHLRGASAAETASGQPCRMSPIAPTAVAFRRPACNCRGLAHNHAWGVEGCVRP